MTAELSRVDLGIWWGVRRFEPAATRALRRVGLTEPRAKWFAEAVSEFVAFGVKAAWACLFGALMLGALLVTSWYWPPVLPIARYDFLFVFALGVQATFLATRLERPREAVVICVFHLVGTVMEVFKTAQGSWAYPGAGLLFLGGVPLFSGFMYAAVGSYLARAWRTMRFGFEHHPPLWAVMALALAAYVNFFTHHYVADVRWALFAASLLLFGRTVVRFTVLRRRLAMPLLLALALTSGFIYLAENIGTLAGAWLYPDQTSGWRPVGLAKWGSWYLLMLISYGLVALIQSAEPEGETVLQRG